MTQKYVTSIQDGTLKTVDFPEREISFRDNAELVMLVKQLSAQGYAFVDAPSGWPPAAVLQQLQDQGEMDFSFTAITWSGPRDYRTYQVPKC